MRRKDGCSNMEGVGGVGTSLPAVDHRVRDVTPVRGADAAAPPSHSSAQVFQVKVRETRKFVVVEFASLQQLVRSVDVNVQEIRGTRRDRNKEATLRAPHCSSDGKLNNSDLVLPRF